MGWGLGCPWLISAFCSRGAQPQLLEQSHPGWWRLDQKGGLSQVLLFWPLKCAAVVPFGLRRLPRALVLQGRALGHESCCRPCAALAWLSGPLGRGQGAMPSGFYLAYCFLGWRGLGGTNPQHTQGSPPPRKGEGWAGVT